MALDSRFILASDLQSLFRDKASGAPLRNGVIYLWKDAARSEPKDVYKLSGSPADYTYTNIGNEITLTAAGTFSDNENPANDIVPYWFPYEGTPDVSDGTIELYYVQVYSEGGTVSGVLQFTREAWPNVVAGTDAESQNLQNYIPNGQFKIHSNIPADATASPALIAGEIREAVTNLSQGGWTFERPVGSVAKDIVLFQSFGSYVANPSASPAYYIEIENQAPSAGDAFKDLRIKFDDVNKFASAAQEYTFSFTGRSNSGSVNVSLILIKNYGTGGDPEEEIPIGNFVVTNAFTILQKNGFTFGDNEGKTIGTQGDDFIQLALRFPTGSLFDVLLTDFILTIGNFLVTSFPQTPDRQFEYESITPALPAYDNSNLYLPVVLGAQGLIYDNSVVGDVVSESQISLYVNSLHPTSNRLLPDGSQYETAGYSPLNIPYARLQAKYWLTSLSVPMYGTGAAYATAYISDLSPATQIRLSTNARGAVTNTADGTATTGFTFATAHTGANYGVTASRYDANTLIAIDDFVGLVPVPTPGTSGFGVEDIINQSGQKHIFLVAPVAAAGLAGTYWTWNDPGNYYYMWFTVDGAGADPAVPGGTGIKVDLKSTYTDDEVTCFVLEAMSGYQISTIVTVAASAMTGGDYFNFSTLTQGYYVWYKIASAGADPAVVGRLGIQVNLGGTETAAQVATATQIAINSKYFAVPSFQGLFPRFYDPNQNWDVDATTRFGKVASYYGNEIGLMQLDEFFSHKHGLPGYTGEIDDTGSGGGTINIGTAIHDPTTSYAGGNETRGVNAVLNAAIIY